MSYTNSTPNYKLPQYVGTDKPTFLGDFNNAMAIIDTQMHANAENAGEGIASLQKAQAQLTETQSTLTEVQSEVANVSGIASTVNENVQQALSAANDASEAATQAQSQIQPAVTAANQASADAQAAQQVANGNITTLNELSERTTALEQSSTSSITTTFDWNVPGYTGAGAGSLQSGINAPSGKKVKKVTIMFTAFEVGQGTTFDLKADKTALKSWSSAPELNTPFPFDTSANAITINAKPDTNRRVGCSGSLTVEFGDE